jgi:hypothetical protein
MNNYNNNDRNGSYNFTPSMVLPNGQVIFSTQPKPHDYFRFQALSETRKKAHNQGWVGSALLGLALVVAPMALLVTRLVTF